MLGSMQWQEWERWAAEQYGYVAARQARSDSEPHAWRRTAARRGWDRTCRGVVGAPWSDLPERRLCRTLLWVGPPAALTGWSAVWLNGLVGVLPTRSHVLIDHQRRLRRQAKAIVSRSRHFDQAAIEAIRGLPTVSVAWAITDLAPKLDRTMLRAIIIDARQRRLLALGELAELLALRGPIPGARALRSLLRELDAERADSVLELELRNRIRSDLELPPPASQHVPVRCTDGRTVEVDVGWPTGWVGLECLGMGSHADRVQLDVDALRTNGLAGTPWTIFVATWRHVEDDAAWQVLRSQILAALRAAGHGQAATR